MLEINCQNLLDIVYHLHQYALHTTSFEEQPLSDRTLSRFRARALAYETEHNVDLIHECIIKMSKELAKFMKISSSMQRMDSLMVAANIRNLSLLELFYTCVANLAKIMNERGIELSEKHRHYIEKDDYNCFIHHKREQDAVERTVIVMHDAEELIAICGSTGDFDDTSEYQLLIRLLKEQTVSDDDGPRRLRKKEEKENPSEVLLNPSDPEATFRYKAGGKHLGYVGNIVESVGKSGSLITDYAYEKNTYADNQFMKNYLEQQPYYEDEVLLVADGAYSGQEVLKCANGQKPLDCSYDKHNDRCNVHFCREVCESCSHKEQCNPKFRKKATYLEVPHKAVNRAQQLRFMKTEDFKNYAHFRNGVEAIPSLLRRRYHVDKIPAHGQKRTRLHFGFKIAALNFQKLLDYANGLELCTSKEEIA